MDRSRRRIGLILLLGLLGCGSDERPLRTRALAVKYRLISYDGIESVARAEIRNRRGELVLLPGTDEVQIAFPGWQIELIPRSGAQPYYESTLPAAPAGAVHSFALVRMDARPSGFNEVILPAEPALSAPPAWQRSTEDLVVTWSPEALGEPLKLSLHGSCLGAGTTALVDDALGSHSFPAGSLPGSGECSATLTLRRRNIGVMDDGVRAGSVWAVQQREAVIAVTP